ncbi:unnamed protein product [Lactuca saligna]|uniref:Uncharacterized protein n=1 Tax=Lactuca saligna TaxID=75948 RepID=A0AA35Z114_LACSI|nr:unnamed protein product [Lactuca saligna]
MELTIVILVTVKVTYAEELREYLGLCAVSIWSALHTRIVEELSSVDLSGFRNCNTSISATQSRSKIREVEIEKRFFRPPIQKQSQLIVIRFGASSDNRLLHSTIEI